MLTYHLLDLYSNEEHMQGGKGEIGEHYPCGSQVHQGNLQLVYL